LALMAGSIAIGLSALMLPFNTRLDWIGILIRDIGQICRVGILLPLICIRRSSLGWAAFGFSFRRWPVYLVVNLVLGFLLLLSESPPPASFRLNAQILWSAAYVMLALCFELIFFYAFLRTQLERAFGVFPAIVLTALFYAFHHVGFQPEYCKLFFVGLIYATIFRIGNSVWLIFPLFSRRWCGIAIPVVMKSDHTGPDTDLVNNWKPPAALTSIRRPRSR
jgi:membrane protease YdiL (CAAX protease family)